MLEIRFPLERRCVRVVEGARLESVCAGNRTVSSNLILSARRKYPMSLQVYGIFSFRRKVRFELEFGGAPRSQKSAKHFSGKQAEEALADISSSPPD